MAHEADLLVIAPGGVCMIEPKDWHASLTSENGTWAQTTPNGHRRPHGNPLHLANKKAKELAGLLGQTGHRVRVAEAVCFTNDALRVRPPAHDENGVHTVTELVEMRRHSPQRRRVQGRPVRLELKPLVRQLAETMRSAHSSRIHHRAPAAHSVQVIPRNRGRQGQRADGRRRRLPLRRPREGSWSTRPE
ncbi:nuclease-related domain-containing protein [Streptomyces sp. NPDC058405]|uniref:nuclease-related domain-containing protein n=1 Tax=Streptomyces sp. NPDC058405 TaxID=3346482 RepID=UPI003658F6F4